MRLLRDSHQPAAASARAVDAVAACVRRRTGCCCAPSGAARRPAAPLQRWPGLRASRGRVPRIHRSPVRFGGRRGRARESIPHAHREGPSDRWRAHRAEASAGVLAKCRCACQLRPLREVRAHHADARRMRDAWQVRGVRSRPRPARGDRWPRASRRRRRVVLPDPPRAGPFKRRRKRGAPAARAKRAGFGEDRAAASHERDASLDRRTRAAGAACGTSEAGIAPHPRAAQASRAAGVFRGHGAAAGQDGRLCAAARERGRPAHRARHDPALRGVRHPLEALAPRFGQRR